MSVRAGRTYVLEPAQGERGLEAPLGELNRMLGDLVGALMVVGGEFTVRADRVRIGEIPGGVEVCQKCGGARERSYDGGKVEPCRSCNGEGSKVGRPDPISETVGFIVAWRQVPQLEDSPLTSRLMDHILGGEVEPEPEPATTDEIPADPAPATPAELAAAAAGAALAAELAADFEAADEADEEPYDDDEDEE